MSPRIPARSNSKKPRTIKNKNETRAAPALNGLASARAKFSRPQLHAIYARTRLFEWLDAACHFPVIWVEGPPGAGKTTLVASYLSHRKHRCLWYQVDGGDRDLASFFHYLGLAVAQTNPRFRRPMPKLTPEYLGGLATFTRNFFRELTQRLKPPFVLVFDNLQEVGLDAPLYEVLLEGSSELPDGVHTILISRAASPEAFARSRLEKRFTLLDWKTLRLDENEAIEFIRFLHREGRRALSDGEIRRSYRQCDGWIAGLLLLQEGAGPEGLGVEPLDPAIAQNLFDYFAAEVFARRHPAVKELLMQTALFPSFTTAMAERLTGNSRARTLLNDLVRQHHFIVELRSEPTVTYQYHPLFRQFLLDRATAAWGNVDFIRQRHRAARILEQNGELEQALALYLDTGDAMAVTRLLLAQAPSLVAAGRYKILSAAIARLPFAVIEQEPWLRYWLGVSVMVFDPAAGQPHLTLAYERFQEKNDLVGLWLAWASVVDAIWQQQRDWTLLDPWIGRLEKQLQNDGWFPSTEIAARVVSSLFLVLIWHMPNHPQMARWAEEAAKLWQHTSEFSLRLRVGVGLQFYYVHTGAFSRAQLLGETQHRLAKRKDVSPGAALLAHMISVYVSAFSGLYPEVSEYSRAALDLSSATGINVFNGLVYGAALYATLGAEDLNTADKLLDNIKAMIVTQPTSLDTAHYHIHCSWRARLAGDREHAVQHAKLAVEIAARIGAYLPEICCHHGLAHAYLICGDSDAARRENEIARSQAHRANFHWWIYLCEMFEAYVAFECDEEALGVGRLREALVLQERFGMGCHFPYWHKDMIARLCAKAFEHNVATPYVRKLLHVYKLEHIEPPFYLDTWPFPVKVYTLGRFSVLLDDKPLKFAAKAQKKPMELLKCLIAMGGRDVQEGRLTEALWPQAEGDAAAQSLATTLHRLRKLLGEEAIERQEGRLTLNPKQAWVDLWVFERQMTALESACRERQHADVARLGDRMLNLYRGGFLQGETDAPWALAMRERLRGKCLRLIETTAGCLTGAQHHELALACYQKAIEMDPLAEGFYRGLMRCYHVLGRRAEALTTYRRCREILGRHLGIVPSPQTEALYQQLLSP